MMTVSDAIFLDWTINIVIDASRNVIDDYKLILQIVASPTIIIYKCNVFKVQATDLYTSRRATLAFII